MKRKLSKIISGLLITSLTFGFSLLSPLNIYALGQTWNFGYTGGVQTFTAPYTGTYQLELWGAQGGNGERYGVPIYGGEGGYSRGKVSLTAGQNLYIYVGGQGGTGSSSYYINGGYNGGGNAVSGGWYLTHGSGGGATDIRTTSDGNWEDYLNNRIIVAGGGGGAGGSGQDSSGGGTWSTPGGAGGGLNGISAQNSSDGNRIGGGGGTQTYGGSYGTYDGYTSTATSGGFGYGGTSGVSSYNGYVGGAGGGGYYGGGGGASGGPGGGGGSGYYGSVQEGQTIAGDQWMPSPYGGNEIGQGGNGYVRITSLNSPPSISVSTPLNNQQFAPGTTMTLSGSISDPDARGTMYVKYDIDGGSAVTVATLTDTSYNQNFNYNITIPSNISLGNHTLYVWGEDSENGISPTQSVTFNIKDTIPPTVSITENMTSWSQGVTLYVNATDNVYVAKIQLPNGNWVNGSNTSYVVSSNGTYTFVAQDEAGNQTSKSITVENVDTVSPILTLAENPTTYTNGQVVITANATDAGSGVKNIELPDGSWVAESQVSYTVSQNGTYHFVAQDNSGNQTSKDILVSNIDYTAPTAPTISNNRLWANSSSVPVTIISGIDSLSGVNRTEYSLSGVTSQDWTIYNGVFNITNEGITTISARSIDNAKNISSVTTSVVKIDRTSPVNPAITIIPK